MKDYPEHKQELDQPGRTDPLLSTLTRLSQVILNETASPTLMDVYVRTIFESLSCACCRILVLESDTDTFQVAAFAGACVPKDGEPVRIGRQYTLADQALTNSEIVLSEVGGDRPDRPVTGLPGEPALKAISAPLTGELGPFGVLEVLFWPDQVINSRIVPLIRIAANSLSTALDRIHTSQELHHLDERLNKAISQRADWIQLLSETAIAANEAASVPEVMQTVLTKICLYTRWPVGHVYIPANDGRLVLQPTPVWFTRDPERYQAFIQVTRQTQFPIGASLPGKVFESGKPVWVEDISVKGFLRAAEAKAAGLKAAFAFPVQIQHEVVAVMEFFTDRAMPPDQPFLDIVANIGIQVGRVMERRRAQEELEIIQRQLAEAHRIARLGTWEWNMVTDRLTWSDRLYEIFGIDLDEFNNSYQGFLDMVHPDDRDRVDETIRNVIAQPKSFEYQHRIIRPDGDIRVLQARGDVILDSTGTPIRMVGTGQDITRRAQMEEELRTHEELLSTVITAAPIILWAVDRKGTITLAEGMGLASLGVTSQDLLGRSISDIAGVQKELLDYIQRALSGEQVVAEMDTNGYVFETRFAPMLDKDNEIVGVTAVSIDITSRVKAEVARQASDARFRVIFEGSAIGIGVINLDHKLLVVNPILQQMLAQPVDEIHKQRVEAFIHPRDRSESKAQLDNLLAGHKPLFRKEVRLVPAEQGAMWVNLSASLVRNPNGTPNFAIVMLEDITSRKQMEAELIEIQQQLVASREKERLHLAQEIHDDPLQNLYGLLYQLDSVLEEVSSEKGTAEIREMQTSINQIINTLRGICRGLRPPTLMPFGLEVSIREHIDSFQKEHPDLNIHLDLMYDGQSLPEHIRLTLFRIYQQAISNVVRHARANNVTIRFRFNDRLAELVVEDDGQGFPVPGRWVELVRKNHMGLAGSAERVEILHGRFSVTSSPDQGTRIEALVPRSPLNSEQDLLLEEIDAQNEV